MDPARRNQAHNPFNRLLSDALETEGCRVTESTRLNRLTGRYDVVHIHWPQNATLGPFWRSSLGAAADLAGYALQRARGAALVWTAHNVHAHEGKHPQVEAILMAVFCRLLSGVVYMSETSRAEAEAAFPVLRSVSSVLVPHGLYGQTYPDARPREIVRQELGVGTDVPLLGFLGEIRPYKGLLRLLDGLDMEAPGALMLLIAGRLAGSKDFAETTRSRIDALRAKGHSILFLDRRLSDQDLVDFIEASDMLAFPYEAIANSGAALLALERDRIILTSDKPLFRELADEVGPERVRILPSVAGLADALAAATQQAPQPDSLNGLRTARSWHTIAARTAAFYRGLRTSSAFRSTAR
jgi:glycosyltransferase involved in cell wall biosynthesis